MVGKELSKLMPDRASDDFTLIKGIGPAVQKRLHEANIFTFTQLASLKPKKLAKLLEDMAGFSPERITSQDWIGQANRMAIKTEKTTINPSTYPINHSQHYASFTVKLLLDKDNLVRRTQVENIQNNEEISAWAGWDIIRLSQFFKSSARLNIPVPEYTPDSKPEKGDQSPKKKETQDSLEKNVEVSSHMLKGIPIVRETQLFSNHGERLNNFVEDDEPFRVHLFLDLSEIDNPSGEKLNYQVTLFTKPFGSRSRTLAGQFEGTYAADETPEIKLQAKPLSPGEYLLEALVALRPVSLPDHPTNRILGFMEGLRLHVG